MKTKTNIKTNNPKAAPGGADHIVDTPPSVGLCDVADLAGYFKVSNRHVQKLAATGVIPCWRLGTRKGLRFDFAAVMRALEGRNQ